MKRIWFILIMNDNEALIAFTEGRPFRLISNQGNVIKLLETILEPEDVTITERIAA